MHKFVTTEERKESSVIGEEVKLTEEVDFRVKEVKTVEQERFMQVYLEDLSRVMNLTQMVEIKVLLWAWKNSSYNESGSTKGNEITIVSSHKEQMAEELGYAKKVVSNTVYGLAKKGLLIRVARSRYVLNPKFFFKGKLKDRLRCMQYILEYRIEEAETEQEEGKRHNGSKINGKTLFDENGEKISSNSENIE